MTGNAVPREVAEGARTQGGAGLLQIFRVLVDNPFRLLGLTPRASAREVEREGAKLLALLAAGLDDPSGMAPFGPQARSAEQVRWAIAELREPHRRAVHEFFWPACESLPVDAARLEALLASLPSALPGEATLSEVLRDLAGELIPEPPPFEIPPALAARLERLLAPRPRATRAPEVCADALGLAGLFPLPGKDERDGER